MKRTKTEAMLVLVGVFALGGLAGAGGVWAWTTRESDNYLSAGPGERMAARYLRAFASHLDLSADQRAQIREILLRHQVERQKIMRRLGEGCGQELKNFREGLDAEIRAVLTPEQRERFDALIQKRRTRFPLFESPAGPAASH